LGNAGAGYGARAGAYKGGLGSASLVTQDGWHVGALTAVNAFGSPVATGSDALWAWPYEQRLPSGAWEFGGRRPPSGWSLADLDWPGDTKTGSAGGRENTTIAVVAVNAILTPAEAKRLAIMAQDGLARALRPVHAPFDGDVVFALATGERALSEPRALSLARLGHLAADCLARAIARGVYEADSLPGSPSYRAVFGL